MEVYEPTESDDQRPIALRSQLASLARPRARQNRTVRSRFVPHESQPANNRTNDS